MREAEHLDDCYRRLREYCSGIEPEYQYMSWEHARRIRLLAQWRRRCELSATRVMRIAQWSARRLDIEAQEIEECILRRTYATFKPHIQTGRTP